MKNNSKITMRSVLIGALFVVVFSILTVFLENRRNTYLAAAQIVPAPYVLLFFLVLLINPICKLLRVIKRFTITEVLVVFIMGSVAAGIPTFGLASQVVPVIHSLFNEHWNNPQTEWNLYVEPYVNESFFLAHEGIQSAAQAYRDELRDLRTLEDAYSAALRLEKARDAVKQAKDSLAETTITEPKTRESRAGDALNPAEATLEEARKTWHALEEENELPGPDTVLATFPQRIEAQRKVVETRLRELQQLEENAFKKVELFRRGLPEGMRAYPGIVPLASESFSIYVNRLRRLSAGTKARRALDQAEEALEEFAAGVDRQTQIKTVVAATSRAADHLRPHTERTDFMEEKREAEAEWTALNTDILELQGKLRDVRNERRTATADEFTKYDRGIDALADEIAELAQQRKRAAAQIEDLRTQLRIAERVAEIVAGIESLRTRIQEMPRDELDSQAALTELQKIIREFPSIDASWRRFFLGDVPWGQWVTSVSLWFLIAGLTYAILLSFNVLIFRQWAYNERLTYPLAELPEIVAGHGQVAAEESVIPPIFKSGLFWAGFSVSGLFVGWNVLCHANIISGLEPFDFMNKWEPYITGTILEGLLPSARSSIFFTLIGLTFLIPAKISFSLWFFSILYMLQLLILVWAGFGVNENSFPNMWWYTLNFRTAEGGGALMLFAVVVLYKCRRYLLSGFRPNYLQGLETSEQRELRISSFIFLFSSLGLVAMLWLGLGANLLYTLFLYFIVLMLTIGLVRAVTEGGILGFQAWVSPFHFIRTLFGMDKKWTSPSLYAPLMIFYSIFFLDLKTFIAPAMANSLKIRDDRGMSRGRFHVALILAIALAVLASIIVHIMMGYSRGADSMNGWFYTNFPRSLFQQIANMTQNPPVDETQCRWWFVFGVVMMGGLLFFRQRLFWLPHPIGLIMLVNPLMRTYWFSILLAWIAKSLVTKYGTKNTYRHTRKFFIGLILGELAMVVLGMILALALNRSIPVDLNR
ncbi:MAG: hypothetical protein K9N51_12020 [Candidatus Pacebacteria bacterium]|nr:hypothetical protein [Candidatus Paceibacterota bacterium]